MSRMHPSPFSAWCYSSSLIFYLLYQQSHQLHVHRLTFLEGDKKERKALTRALLYNCVPSFPDSKTVLRNLTVKEMTTKSQLKHTIILNETFRLIESLVLEHKQTCDNQEIVSLQKNN